MLDTKYNELVDYYDDNKDRPFHEWLEFDRMVKAPGKQGIVGLLKSKDGKYKFIFKMSQTMSFIVEQELTVMQGLNRISEICPYFCKGVGTLKCKIEPDICARNPFKIKNKYPIYKDLLLVEYVEKSSKLGSYIQSKDIPETVIFSLVKQVLMGVSIAQKLTSFAHYDLHSDNVMVKKCYKDLVFVYSVDDENHFCIPSLGYYPVIIDFGFSYIGNMDHGPMWSSLAYTDTGFMSDRFDWVADPKLFLVTVSKEMKDYRPKSKAARKFRNVVYNMFQNLTIDMKCGWDTETKVSAVEEVIEKLADVKCRSKIFVDYVFVCFDILQSLIILPLEEQSNSGDICKVYEVFLSEWVKIENEMGSEFYNIYVLKEMVSLARDQRAAYEAGDANDRARAVREFKRDLLACIDDVCPLCEPQKVHYERLLCSLFVFSRALENMLYHIMEARMEEKRAEYAKMPLQSIEEMYGVVETNTDDAYVFNQDTVFLVMDIQKGTHTIFNIPEDQVDNMNDISPLLRGGYIKNLLSSEIGFSDDYDGTDDKRSMGSFHNASSSAS